jgi:rhomboid protease GluP
MLSKTPKVTLTVLLITAISTGLQLVFPPILSSLQRTPAALSGEWWRLITPIVMNRGGWPEIFFNMFTLAAVGTVVEQHWGGPRWLVFYLTGGFAGEIAGLAWRPVGAGSSVAVCGLMGALAVWLCSRASPWYFRLLGASILAGAMLLTGLHNLHGPPSLASAVIAVVFFRRDKAQQGAADDGPTSERQPRN